MRALDQKRLLVVGGTSGIGLSAAAAFVREGARVVAFGRSEETVAQARQALGPDTFVFTADATDPATLDRAVAECRTRLGGLDGLYHVAGGSGRRHGDGPLHELTDEGWEKTLQLNLTSVAWSNRVALRQFLAQGTGGSIVNVGSVLSSRPAPRYFATHAYATAKAGIVGLSRSLAATYAPHNIRVNVIAPALVDTPMAQRAVTDPEIVRYLRTRQPLDGARLGQPEDLDGAAVYFLSDAARYVTGQVLCIDGGWSVSEGQY